MPRVSPRPLKKEIEKEITANLDWTLSQLKSEAIAKDFLEDFLTNEERLMLAKRLAVVYHLDLPQPRVPSQNVAQREEGGQRHPTQMERRKLADERQLAGGNQHPQDDQRPDSHSSQGDDLGRNGAQDVLGECVLTRPEKRRGQDQQIAKLKARPAGKKFQQQSVAQQEQHRGWQQSPPHSLPP